MAFLLVLGERCTWFWSLVLPFSQLGVFGQILHHTPESSNVNECGYHLHCSLNSFSLSDSDCFWNDCSVMAWPVLSDLLGFGREQGAGGRGGGREWPRRLLWSPEHPLPWPPPRPWVAGTQRTLWKPRQSVPDQGCAPRPRVAAEGSRGRRPACGTSHPSQLLTVSWPRPRGACVQVSPAWPWDPARPVTWRGPGTALGLGPRLVPAPVSPECPSRLLSGCSRSRSCSL